MKQSNPENCLILLGLLLCLVTGRVLATDRIYTFGVVPQQSAIKTAELWLPLIKRVSDEAGVKIIFRTNPSIPEFESALAEGRYDFAYMNPYHYVHFHEAVGYQGMAHAKDSQLTGIILTRKDSNLTKLSDLEGKVLAFPSKAAFAASILPRAALRQQGISFTPEYVNSHDSVYLNVYHGSYQAGGGVIRTLNNMDGQYKDELNVLWTSEGYTPHAIAHLPSVTPEVVNKVAAALTGLDKDEGGKKLLEHLKMIAWQDASDSDWDDVRSLNIQLLENKYNGIP